MGDTVSENVNPQEQLRSYAMLLDLSCGQTFKTDLHTYKLINCIGEGGMAQVWKATTEDQEIVAIKFIRQVLSSDDAYRLRLKKEAALAKDMIHPNVVKVIEFAELEHVSFLVMEYLRGGDLYDYMHAETGIREIVGDYGERYARDDLPLKNVDIDHAVDIMAEIADIYVKAHLNGRRIVHRDLKPENILLDEEKRPRLSDFGIAKDLDSTTQLTKTGVTPGTFLYMAPERIEGEDSDISVQSDMYSLGIILYYMLTGRPPFYADDTNEMLNLHLNGIHKPARELNPAISDDLSAVISCLLAKLPQDRFTPAGLVAALARVKTGLSPEFPPAFEEGKVVTWNSDEGEVEQPKENRMKWLLGTVIVILLILLGAVLYIKNASNNSVADRTSDGRQISALIEQLETRWQPDVWEVLAQQISSEKLAFEENIRLDKLKASRYADWLAARDALKDAMDAKNFKTCHELLADMRRLTISAEEKASTDHLADRLFQLSSEE